MNSCASPQWFRNRSWLEIIHSVYENFKLSCGTLKRDAAIMTVIPLLPAGCRRYNGGRMPMLLFHPKKRREVAFPAFFWHDGGVFLWGGET